MIDHILQFADEAEALAALSPLDLARQDKEGVWNWDTSRVIPGQAIISAEAEWDKSDPQKPTLTKEEVKEPGFWVLVALPDASPLLKAMPTKLSQIRDREKAAKGEAHVSDDAGVVGASRLAPVFAGSKYQFGGGL